MSARLTHLFFVLTSPLTCARYGPAVDTRYNILALQGSGGGGIMSVSGIILSDLVPLGERPMYLAAMGLWVDS